MKINLTLIYATTLALIAPLLSAEKPRLVVDARWNFLVGGSLNGKWLQAQEAAKLVRGGEVFLITDGRKSKGTTKGSKVISGGGPCEHTRYVSLSGATDGIGVSGASFKAGSVRELSTAPSECNAALAAWLKTRGIAKPNLSVIKVWLVDLDGDGAREQLIEATRHTTKNYVPRSVRSDSIAGDYSVLLLRQKLKLGWKTTSIVGQAHPKDATFNAPQIHELAAVLDINGDGKKEIITRDRYYEGNATTVYTWNGKQVARVLSTGCGV
jgi:hypothetical protein